MGERKRRKGRGKEIEGGREEGESGGRGGERERGRVRGEREREI